MKKPKLIIDTDIADDIDDAYALQYAVKSGDFDILGVTTVYKNVVQRARIAKKLLTELGFGDIPVFTGANKPVREAVRLFSFEKEKADGLPDLLSYGKDAEGFAVEAQSAVDFILETAEKYPHEVTLCAIGPLTNLYYALQKKPESFALLKKIVIMSGIFSGSAPEWNVICDPEATDAVYGCGASVYAVGVEVTRQTEFNPAERARAQAIESAGCPYLHRMTEEWVAVNKRPPIMHDVLAVSAILHNYVSFTRRTVRALLSEGKRGVVEYADAETGGVFTSSGVDRDGFMQHFFEVISRT
jgi:purine nucleosidase/pyrimidine-specific ribonucleoside hydrolase